MSIIAEPVDELVEAALVLRLDSPALARALRRKVSGSGKAAAKNVTDLEQRITQLGLDLDAGIVDRREWLARRGPLIERLETARAELEPVTPTAGAKELAALAEAADIPGRWKQLDLDQRRNIASAMIDRITIMAPVPGAAGRFDPDRVDIAWRA